MPAVELVGDRPSGRRGKKFVIQRFRTMHFNSRSPVDSVAFETAEVYVFLKTGELVLQQEFPVKLPPPPVSQTETPSAEARSAGTSSVAKPSYKALFTETPSEKTPPVEEPSVESPSGDETIDYF
jgi:hypothetical protein